MWVWRGGIGTVHCGGPSWQRILKGSVNTASGFVLNLHLPGMVTSFSLPLKKNWMEVLAGAAVSGAGWQRSQPELALGSQIPLSGLKHGPGTWPSNPASPRHGRHAQEREATQVPGPRRLLRKSDRGGLCQLGSGSREVWKGQESCRQCCSAGSKISLWLGSLPGSCSGSSFWGW